MHKAEINLEKGDYREATILALQAARLAAAASRETITLKIEKTETTTLRSATKTTHTSAIVIGLSGQGSVPYVAAIFVAVILSVVIYWRKTKQRRSP